ncbi:LamG domain-containing protein, partial [Myxococcota bacterium]|nr:LamG domain-containing protein [Myxococcota bacterium]
MTLTLLTLTLSPSALAQEVLRLEFDDPADPFADSSPVGHVLSSATFTEASITGAGVSLDTSTPSPAGGYSAWFDGGSALSFPASADLVFAAGADFTVTFWMRSPGLVRPSSFGKYNERMHITGFFGRGSGVANFDIDLNDVDSSGRGLWVYWHGGGTPQVWTPSGTMGYLTTDEWLEVSIVRSSNTINLYVRDTVGNVTLIDTETGVTGQIGASDSAVVNYIGAASDRGAGGLALGYYGWLDGFLVTDTAITPTSGPVDWCDSLSGTQ